MRWVMLFLMALGLSACGRSAEEEIRIEQPTAWAYAALSRSSIAAITPIYPDLSIERSKPGENEILYTVRGSTGTGDATVRFLLEPADGGRATIVRTTIAVPPVRMVVDGKNMVLSEAKIAALVRGVLAKFSATGDRAAATGALSGVLATLAIDSNKEARDLALSGKTGTRQAGALLAAIDNADPDPDLSADGSYANDQFDKDTQAQDTEASTAEAPGADKQDGAEDTQRIAADDMAGRGPTDWPE